MIEPSTIEPTLEFAQVQVPKFDKGSFLLFEVTLTRRDSKVMEYHFGDDPATREDLLIFLETYFWAWPEQTPQRIWIQKSPNSSKMQQIRVLIFFPSELSEIDLTSYIYENSYWTVQMSLIDYRQSTCPDFKQQDWDWTQSERYVFSLIESVDLKELERKGPERLNEYEEFVQGQGHQEPYKPDWNKDFISYYLSGKPRINKNYKAIHRPQILFNLNTLSLETIRVEQKIFLERLKILQVIERNQELSDLFSLKIQSICDHLALLERMRVSLKIELQFSHDLMDEFLKSTNEEEITMV